MTVSATSTTTTTPGNHDPRKVFAGGLELPRGLERELVQDDRENLYELNREDGLTLATTGAFRVVSERDLDVVGDHDGDAGVDTLEHLRDDGLIRFVAINADERHRTHGRGAGRARGQPP
jgi:hypothetical protein